MTLTVDTDGEFVEWNGAVDLAVDQSIYLTCTPTVDGGDVWVGVDINMVGFIVQVWLSGPGGGGVLWCYNSPQ